MVVGLHLPHRSRERGGNDPVHAAETREEWTHGLPGIRRDFN